MDVCRPTRTPRSRHTLPPACCVPPISPSHSRCAPRFPRRRQSRWRTSAPRRRSACASALFERCVLIASRRATARRTQGRTCTEVRPRAGNRPRSPRPHLGRESNGCACDGDCTLQLLADIAKASRTPEPGVQPLLQKIHATNQRAVPDAQETISYRMPTFTLRGVVLHFAAFRQHIGLYPPVHGDPALMAEISRYAGEKGNLRFPLDQRIPYALIGRLAKVRARQNRDRATRRSVTTEVAGERVESGWQLHVDVHSPACTTSSARSASSPTDTSAVFRRAISFGRDGGLGTHANVIQARHRGSGTSARCIWRSVARASDGDRRTRSRNDHHGSPPSLTMISEFVRLSADRL
jgi:uncharacterized protein YdhG (YjbR/CyaY superfamily)